VGLAGNQSSLKLWCFGEDQPLRTLPFKEVSLHVVPIREAEQEKCPGQFGLGKKD
jgi:hypothetical protein